MLTDEKGEAITRDTELDSLGLSTRVFNVLYREGYRTVGQIMDKNAETPGYWYSLHHIGGKGADEIAAHVYQWSRALL